MTTEDVCKVCKKLCSAHTVQIRWGVAHAGTYNDDRRFVSCSEAANDYNDFRGQIAALTTVVRSLRWRAGRLRTQGAAWHHYDLDIWSNKIMGDIERLRRLIAEHYAWALKEES